MTPWADNGFGSQAAMDASHRKVLSIVEATGVRRGKVLDLGCGDGTLLSRIVFLWPGLEGYGVDADPGRIGRGRLRYPRLNLAVDRIEAVEDRELQPGEEPWDLVVFMPGRLSEMAPDDADRVRRALRRVTRALALYCYDGDVAEVALRVGLTSTPPGPGP